MFKYLAEKYSRDSLTRTRRADVLIQYKCLEVYCFNVLLQYKYKESSHFKDKCIARVEEKQTEYDCFVNNNNLSVSDYSKTSHPMCVEINRTNTIREKNI